MRTTLHTLLAADYMLMAYLTGGIYDAGAVGEISLQNTPDAYDDNEELLPCALVKGEVETPTSGPYDMAARAHVLLIFYQRAASDQIDQALNRCYALLHNQRVSGTWRVWNVGDILDLEDQAISARMHTSRYECIRLRG